MSAKIPRAVFWWGALVCGGSHALGSERPDLAVVPSVLAQRYLFGLIGTHEATIIFRNTTDSDILCAKDFAIDIAIPPDRHIGRLQPEVLPLILPPGGDIRLSWVVAEKLPSQQGGLGDQALIVSAKYLLPSSPQIVREISFQVPLQSPPEWYRFIHVNFRGLLASILAMFILFSLFRFSPKVSITRVEPTTRIGEFALDVWASVCLAIGGLSFLSSIRLGLIVPSLTLVKHRLRKGASPELLLAILRRCEAVIRLGSRDPPLPAGPLFQISWLSASCFDEDARRHGNNETYGFYAERIARQYEEAASRAGEESLKSLSISLGSFYEILQLRFGGPQPPCQPPPLSGSRGSAASIWWAGELLHASIDSGPEGVLLKLANVPDDIRNVPLITWALGPGTSWPPSLPGAAVDEKHLSTRDLRQRGDRCYRLGNTTEGMLSLTAALGLADKHAAPDLLTKLVEDPNSYSSLFALARLTAQHLRLMRVLPFEKPKVEFDTKLARAWVVHLGRIARNAASRQDATSWATAVSLAAEFRLILGDWSNSLQSLDALDRVRLQGAPEELGSQATALKLRARIYMNFGAARRAMPLLTEAASWFAYLSDWDNWVETAAMWHQVALMDYETTRRNVSECRDAVAELHRLADSAGLQLPARGRSLLIRELALWGEFVSSVPSTDLDVLAPLLDRIDKVDSEFRFNMIGLILFRCFPFVGQILGKSLSLRATNFYMNHFTWMARRQHHTNLILSNFHAARLLPAGSVMAFVLLRKADQLVRTGRLNIPASVRWATEAEMIMVRASRASRVIPPNIMMRSLHASIKGIAALASESREAPTELLRRTSTIQRVTVLNQFIRSLALATSSGVEAPGRFLDEAYLTLQALRAGEWNDLAVHRLLGSDDRVSHRTARLMKVHQQLTALCSGGFAVESIAKSRALAVELSGFLGVPLMEATGREMERALHQIRAELDDGLQRAAEAARPEIATAAVIEPLTVLPTVPEGAAVVEFVRTPEAACAFLVANGKPIRFFDLTPLVIPPLNEIYANILRDVSGTTEPWSAEGGANQSEWDAALAKIAQAIWPVELRRELQDYSHIYIVPWGDLWNVPFAALPGLTGVPIVLESDVSLLPSIQFLQSVATDSVRVTDDEVCVIAHDALSYQEGALGLESEVTIVKSRLPRAETILGDQATPGRLLDALDRYRWVHIACHGFTDAESPMFSRLSLAPTLNGEDDGSFYLYQLRSRSHSLYGVFLNACESNLGRTIGDRPDTLAAGFMSIGAQAVIGTLGTICDDVAIDVARDFYQHLPHSRPEQALCIALRNLASLDPSILLEGSRIPKSHPLAWWPFVCISRGHSAEFPPRES